MTIEELQDLSKASIEGADEFDSTGYEKGMRLAELPDDIDDDVKSGYLLSSEGLIVKEATKWAGSHTSSKDHSKGQSQPKKPKQKIGSGKEKFADKDKGKKKKYRKIDHTGEGDTSTTADGAEADVEEADVALEENTGNVAEQEQVVGREQEGEQNVEHITLSDEHEDPPHVAYPFIHMPWVAGTYNFVKENDRGLHYPEIATAIIDSIVCWIFIETTAQSLYWTPIRGKFCVPFLYLILFIYLSHSFVAVQCHLSCLPLETFEGWRTHPYT